MTPTPEHTPSFDELQASVDELAALIDRVLDRGDEDRILGPTLTEFAHGSSPRPPRRVVITLAVLTDCLRVAEAVIDADGRVSKAESDYVYPLVAFMARALSRLRRAYREVNGDDVEAFLGFYRQDEELFGYACAATRWIGLELCRRASTETHDGEVLELYRRLQIRLTDEVCALSGVTPADAEHSPHLSEVFALRDRLAAPEVVDGTRDDARIGAFLAPEGPQVFSSAAAPSQVWTRDPVDVATVHAEARDAFERLVERVTDPGREGRGRILLVLGESGSGKTHLMRAFRSYVHGRRRGFAGYLQLTSKSQDYADYVLRNLIDSLDRKYDPPEIERTGLALLSDALTEVGDGLDPAVLTRLREGDFATGQSDELISPLVDRLLAVPGLDRCDPDLMRALLYLQTGDRAISSRVFKYLRCEQLTDYDRGLLGGIASRARGDDAERTVAELGRVMWHTSESALVLLVDQLEDLHNLDQVGDRARRAVDVLRQVAENVPSAVVVISCLDDLYATLRDELPRAARDRLERDPDHIQLTSRRTADDIEALVGRRLEYLYEEMDVRWRPDDPLFPFRHADLTRLANLRTRDVLDHCRQIHEACIAAQVLPEALPTPPPSALLGGPVSASTAVDFDAEDAGRTPSASASSLAREWNDFRIDHTTPVPEDDKALLALLAYGVKASAAELGDGYRVACAHDGELLRVTAQRVGHRARRSALGVCNKGARGGGLARQIDELVARLGRDEQAVLVRSTEFPHRAGTQIAGKLAALVREGARRVVIEDAEWRAMQAYQTFAAEHEGTPGLSAWAADERPLSQLPGLSEILAIDELSREPPLAPSVAAPAAPAASAAPSQGHGAAAPTPGPASPQPSPTAAARPQRRPERVPTVPPADRRVDLGRTGNLPPAPLALDLDELTRHAAFLGSTGSGKTTLALAIIEQALARGIPALLIDRKGDLCRYADAEWWHEPAGDLEHEARKRTLHQRAEVHLYTPGAPNGRALGLPVVPAALAGAGTLDRARIAGQAANALAAMMDYRQNKSDQIQETILAKAIELLGSIEGAPVDMDTLIDVIERRDDNLINEIGRLAKDKYFDKLVESLELVKQSKRHLLAAPAAAAGGAEAIDPERWFTPAADGGARLTIISTKFLGDRTSIEFWVARLAVEIARWASKRPSKVLQALIFFDEADLYMPAQSKPATKEPMQDLLKRARSAGVGVLLGTQNPGDLDYRSRENVLTWFVGRITEERNLGKLKLLLSGYPMSIAGRLAKKKAGEFFLLRKGQVTEFKANRALMATEQLAEDRIRSLAGATRP
ncbi:helicase HerA domain-containing protein [Haliangium sp.]|uniref:helicase HerA domain-containing protein n=1 Tax=Haliangium sp. TaxID=2663208 RepID=UPI003D0B4275